MFEFAAFAKQARSNGGHSGAVPPKFFLYLPKICCVQNKLFYSKNKNISPLKIYFAQPWNLATGLTLNKKVKWRSVANAPPNYLCRMTTFCFKLLHFRSILWSSHSCTDHFNRQSHVDPS